MHSSAIFIALALYYILDVPEMFLPGVPLELGLGVWYIPIAAFVIVLMSNAINLTDGLDGLAGLISATAFAAYGGIALLQGQVFLARFCFTLVGAIFGFLWFNVHPAHAVHGRYGLALVGRYPGGGGSDDRPVGASAADCRHPDAAWS